MRTHFSNKEKTISDVTFPLPCIVCGKKLEPAFKGEPATQPFHGLCFEAQGAYGSDFDPMDGRLSLIINVCDDCLESKGRQGVVVMVTQERAKLPAPTFESYKP